MGKAQVPEHLCLADFPRIPNAHTIIGEKVSPFGDADLINNEIERYMNVTREDIREAARKYFVPSNRVSLTYLPKSNEKS